MESLTRDKALSLAENYARKHPFIKWAHLRSHFIKLGYTQYTPHTQPPRTVNISQIPAVVIMLPLIEKRVIEKYNRYTWTSLVHIE